MKTTIRKDTTMKIKMEDLRGKPHDKKASKICIGFINLNPKVKHSEAQVFLVTFSKINNSVMRQFGRDETLDLFVQHWCHWVKVIVEE